jgi:Spy/CpxP family protein refolding chaperone
MAHDMSLARKMSLVRKAAFALLLVATPLATAPSANADPDSPASKGASVDPIAQRVFPPELIFGHAAEINLTSNQRERIIAEIRTLQSHVEQVAPTMERARGQMVADLDAEPADETRVLSALDTVLAAERDIKRLNIAALVRVRNVLTPAQRVRLNALR